MCKEGAAWHHHPHTRLGTPPWYTSVLKVLNDDPISRTVMLSGSENYSLTFIEANAMLLPS